MIPLYPPNAQKRYSCDCILRARVVTKLRVVMLITSNFKAKITGASLPCQVVLDAVFRPRQVVLVKF
jgi:hypothetical protein